MFNLVYLYLLSPLHTGGTSQEGNLLGIARESHTNLPYIPSSTIRGKLRAITPAEQCKQLWGNTIEDVTTGGDANLTQGALWVGDGSILWLPVPSLSHGVVWITAPMLLHRWSRLQGRNLQIPAPYSTNLKKAGSTGKDSPVYLKDAILPASSLSAWQDWKNFIPSNDATRSIERVMVLPDQHCATLVQMSLWRQVKVKLDEHKTVEGGFRYEEAIPPDTVMYFPIGATSQSGATSHLPALRSVLQHNTLLQVGGQESLGRGFVQQWMTVANQQEVAV
ncbi:type III-B CRISPR module RAMP protein Cmr4 [Microcoleus sp. FACHB-1515]|uniref:type III-B CRISPR module RAMP protein Cmr4 n=1 Tax=Cyanophyceae TaxID=3028117 RepID=UPI0016889F26|nr:type III-B CRISPR module RAMP protein Cmr4 [Microcoleus sp. FACHB-1515]MBD2090638.1 type III-B CRISPR module RAMP protein Cmr4 [Microcoleus sp. FACHB-1515]